MTKTLLTELPKLIEVIDSNDHKEELIQLINEQVSDDTYEIK
jgi:PII-like signaling protein